MTQIHDWLDWQVACDLLRKEAERQGLTADDIAEKTQLKPATISRIFSIKYPPDLDVFFRIANSLNMGTGILKSLGLKNIE